MAGMFATIALTLEELCRPRVTGIVTNINSNSSGSTDPTRTSKYLNAGVLVLHLKLSSVKNCLCSSTCSPGHYAHGRAIQMKQSSRHFGFSNIEAGDVDEFSHVDMARTGPFEQGSSKAMPASTISPLRLVGRHGRARQIGPARLTCVPCRAVRTCVVPRATRPIGHLYTNPTKTYSHMPPNLWAISISNNSFSGQILQCLGNCTLGCLDVRMNNLHDRIPQTYAKGCSLYAQAEWQSPGGTIVTMFG
ncbi:hypothetical protein WN944_009563 [Citrus x changshan-huyou]|uniref:Uncharacterized protein n=1 Tax=Citrus x changshan-huyou TaxID=2935761 RepID=A0AAP0MQ10_9ROSI